MNNANYTLHVFPAQFLNVVVFIAAVHPTITRTSRNRHQDVKLPRGGFQRSGGSFITTRWLCSSSSSSFSLSIFSCLFSIRRHIKAPTREDQCGGHMFSNSRLSLRCAVSGEGLERSFVEKSNCQKSSLGRERKQVNGKEQLFFFLFSKPFKGKTNRVSCEDPITCN